MTQKLVYSTMLVLMRGDITRQNVEAIINDANSQLKPSRGANGAIHQAAGPAVTSECQQIVEHNGPVEPGATAVTGAGLLKAKYIIHTVAPPFEGGNGLDERALGNTYQNSLKVAADYGLTTVAVTPLGIGDSHWPVERAAQVAVFAVEEFCRNDERLKEVQFVMADDYVHRTFQKAMSY